MRSILSLVTAAAVAGLASTADAQQGTAPKKPDTRTRVSPSESCTSAGGNIECRVFRRADMDSALMKRAALGIELSPTGTMRDTIGVFVARVVPKGPAENAGVIEGDRIVSINGVDLRVNAADAGDSYASGLPSRRLTREVQKLAPGARVNLRVWSGGRVRDVQVTAGRAYDLRDRGAFGSFFEGLPGGAMTLRPGMIQSFPRMNLEGHPRIHFDGRERLQLDGLEKIELDGLRDGLLRLERQLQPGGRPLVRVMSPSRTRRIVPLRRRLLTTTEPIILDEDGEVLLPSKKKTSK